MIRRQTPAAGLVELQTWVDSLVAENVRTISPPTRRRLAEARRALEGDLQDEAATLRSLMAIGLIRFGRFLHYDTVARTPPTVFNAVITHMLWPLVCAPHLPGQWVLTLAHMSDSSVASTVAQA